MIMKKASRRAIPVRRKREKSSEEKSFEVREHLLGSITILV